MSSQLSPGISNFIVLNEFGKPNIEATLLEFQKALDHYVIHNKDRNANIKKFVDLCLETEKGKRVPFSYLASATASFLNVAAVDYNEFQKELQSFIDSNPDYSISKGRHGGVGRKDLLKSK